MTNEEKIEIIKNWANQITSNAHPEAKKAYLKLSLDKFNQGLLDVNEEGQVIEVEA